MSSADTMTSPRQGEDRLSFKRFTKPAHKGIRRTSSEMLHIDTNKKSASPKMQEVEKPKFMGTVKTDNGFKNIYCTMNKTQSSMTPTAEVGDVGFLIMEYEKKAGRTLNEFEKQFLFPDYRIRHSVEPSDHPELMDFYDDCTRMFWTKDELKWSQDLPFYRTATEQEMVFLKRILGFFVSSDKIVTRNIDVDLYDPFSHIDEVAFFFNFQKAIENIHTRVYSQAIRVFSKDEAEELHYINAVENDPSTKRKALWVLNWMAMKHPLIEKFFGPISKIDRITKIQIKLLCEAIMEGVFFSASFAGIYYFRRGNRFPTLIKKNQQISKDEGTHRDYFVMLYKKFGQRLPEEFIYAVVMDALEVEHCFVDNILQEPLPGLNAEDMFKHVMYVTDQLIHDLGYNKLYNMSGTPLTYMEGISIPLFVNMFEKEGTSYGRLQAAGPLVRFSEMKEEENNQTKSLETDEEW